MAYTISDDCIMCGACADNCPCDAISEGDGKTLVLIAVHVLKFAPSALHRKAD